jgi:ketosteroid isomerase-like protein
MSSAISLPGGVPVGLAIFGCFFVSVPAFAASAFTAAVGGDGLAVVVVVAAVEVDDVSDGAELGIAAVFVPPPHAASARAAPAAASVVKNLGRITARNSSGTYAGGDAMATKADTRGRSKEHHLAIGLRFLSSLKAGDVDGCVELLHPDAEWHPSPALRDSEALHGHDEIRTHLQALYDRFAKKIDVIPEDGRQTGDHVLLISLVKGVNEQTGKPIRSRESWVISVRDDQWARIVVYPNAPAARLGFEELVRSSPPATKPTETIPSGVTIPPTMEAALTPAEQANAKATPQPAPPAPAAPPAAASGASTITLTFTFAEAEALNRWLLRPSQDGGLAADDTAVRPGLMKIRTAVEQAQAIADVRRELEQAGIPTQHLTDQQVAQLGRRISQAAPRLGGVAQGG